VTAWGRRGGWVMAAEGGGAGGHMVGFLGDRGWRRVCVVWG
jgi:hypothetical protein